MSTVLDVLIAARGKIARPEDWGKGRRGSDRRWETSCAAEAIEESSELANAGERRDAYAALENAGGIPIFGIVTWNDAPERTYAEVLTAFDRAITVAQLLNVASPISSLIEQRGPLMRLCPPASPTT